MVPVSFPNAGVLNCTVLYTVYCRWLSLDIKQIKSNHPDAISQICTTQCIHFQIPTPHLCFQRQYFRALASCILHYLLAFPLHCIKLTEQDKSMNISTCSHACWQTIRHKNPNFQRDFGQRNEYYTLCSDTQQWANKGLQIIVRRLLQQVCKQYRM